MMGLELTIVCVLVGPYLLLRRDKRPVKQPQREWAPPVVPPPHPVRPVVPPPNVESVVRVIVDDSREPMDERIRKLSNLRYERLITEEEFQAAKAKLLGIN